MVTPLVLMVVGVVVVVVKAVVVALVGPFQGWRVPVPVPGRVRRAGAWLAGLPILCWVARHGVVRARAAVLAAASGFGWVENGGR